VEYQMIKEIKRSAMNRQKARSLDSRPYRIAYSLLVALISIYVVGCLLSLNYQNYISLERDIRIQKAEQGHKLSHISRLKEEKIKLHDIEYLKELARKELYLMPPREVYIKILPNPAKASGKAEEKTRK
jgi:cell division protein FtsB